MARGLDAHPSAAEAVGSLEARQHTEACGLSAGIWAWGESGALREDRVRVCTCTSAAAALISSYSGQSKPEIDVTYISVWGASGKALPSTKACNAALSQLTYIYCS